MMLSTWNFEYALALQSKKTISFHYVRYQMSLFMLFAFPKSIHQSGPFKQCFLLGLFPVCNR